MKWTSSVSTSTRSARTTLGITLLTPSIRAASPRTERYPSWRALPVDHSTTGRSTARSQSKASRSLGLITIKCIKAEGFIVHSSSSLKRSLTRLTASFRVTRHTISTRSSGLVTISSQALITQHPLQTQIRSRKDLVTRRPSRPQERWRGRNLSRISTVSTFRKPDVKDSPGWSRVRTQ